MRTASHDSIPKTLQYLASTAGEDCRLRLQASLQIMDAGDQLLRVLRRRLAQEGLTGEGFQVLASLADLPEVAPLSDLMAIVDMPRAFLSETVTRLEYSGLIERQRGELDRRMIRLRMTDAGRTAIEDARNLVHRSIRQIFGATDEDALRGFAEHCVTVAKEAKSIGQ
ncbi:MAG: winged helix-turn-helix transcriptional regulator [Opitutaceae bacterium]|nr:winged helix-turn-helix transcriptional regulator [Opitutaceae bacterium]